MSKTSKIVSALGLKFASDIDQSPGPLQQRYIWRTMLDGQVRPSHVQREGREFNMSEPIEQQLQNQGLLIDLDEGHPGEPDGCRCRAEFI